MKNKRLKKIVIILISILLIPLIAMQFTDEVNWTLLDFIIAGILLFGTGFMCDFVLRKVKTKFYRIALCIFLLILLIIIWVELAVGIF